MDGATQHKSLETAAAAFFLLLCRHGPQQFEVCSGFPLGASSLRLVRGISVDRKDEFKVGEIAVQYIKSNMQGTRKFSKQNVIFSHIHDGGFASDSGRSLNRSIKSLGLRIYLPSSRSQCIG